MRFFRVLVFCILSVLLNLAHSEIPIKDCELYDYRNCKALREFHSQYYYHQLYNWILMVTAATSVFDLESHNSGRNIRYKLMLDVSHPEKIVGQVGDLKGNLPDSMTSDKSGQVDLSFKLLNSLQTAPSFTENYAIGAELIGYIGNDFVDLKMIPECGDEYRYDFLCTREKLQAKVYGSLLKNGSDWWSYFFSGDRVEFTLSNDRHLFGIYPRIAKEIDLKILDEDSFPTKILGGISIIQNISPVENIWLRRQVTDGSGMYRYQGYYARGATKIVERDTGDIPYFDDYRSKRRTLKKYY